MVVVAVDVAAVVVAAVVVSGREDTGGIDEEEGLVEVKGAAVIRSKIDATRWMTASIAVVW